MIFEYIKNGNSYAYTADGKDLVEITDKEILKVLNKLLSKSKPNLW